MISSSIMTDSCEFKQVEETTQDAIGCVTGVTYGESIPEDCYCTETTYKETEGGKQVNKNGYLLYVNYDAELDEMDKSWVVGWNGSDYAIVNIDRTFEDRHIEIILTLISND